jgi:hypothetical protein
MRSASPDARRAIYEGSLKPQAMDRAGKLSDGSIRIERQIEGIRGDSYAALRSMPEYQKLKAKDQKAVRDIVNQELGRFKAKAGQREAAVPDWTPGDLARAAMQARP